MDGSPSATVLLSGGLDSSACLAYFVEQGFEVTGLFLDYGQVSADRERKAAKAVAAHYGALLREITCAGMPTPPLGALRGRNAFFIQAALMAMPKYAGIIALGIHAGTGYADCSPLFVDIMQAVVDLYCQGEVRVSAPFVDWSKLDIWNYARSIAAPTNLTYSCELGHDQPCGQCPSCRDLEALYEHTC